jgi:hypothetical protein
MAEQDWTPSIITPGHPQKLMKYGFMAAVDLEASRVPEDPVFPAPADGYMVSFVAFYERGLSTPPHWFLRSLLQYYDLELHHLTPSGVLYIAYLGINPKTDLWKDFHSVQCPQDLEARSRFLP